MTPGSAPRGPRAHASPAEPQKLAGLQRFGSTLGFRRSSVRTETPVLTEIVDRLSPAWTRRTSPALLPWARCASAGALSRGVLLAAPMDDQIGPCDHRREREWSQVARGIPTIPTTIARSIIQVARA